MCLYGKFWANLGYLRARALCSQSYFHIIFKGKGYVSCGLLLFLKKEICTATDLYFNKLAF